MAYKNSKQRELILDYMKGIHSHVSAEDVFENINLNEKKISLATVYRNLTILEDMKQIKKIAIPELGYVYDKTCTPHYHFYCKKCKTLYDLCEPYKLELDDDLKENSLVGEVEEHDIIFKGVCKHCK